MDYTMLIVIHNILGAKAHIDASRQAEGRWRVCNSAPRSSPERSTDHVDATSNLTCSALADGFDSPHGRSKLHFNMYGGVSALSLTSYLPPEGRREGTP